MANHSHGQVLADHFRAVMPANFTTRVLETDAPMCTAIDNTRLYTIPWVCRSVEAGSRHWQSVFCYPAWDFSASQLAVVFTLLFFLRLYARKEIHEILRRTHSKDSNETLASLDSDVSGQETCCMGVASPSRQDNTGSKTRKCLRKMSACVMNFLRRASALTYARSKRTVLQILQWWVLMVATLLALLAEMFWGVHTRLGITIALTEKDRATQEDFQEQIPRWLVIPEDFKEGIPHWLMLFSVYSLGALLVVYVFSLLSIVLQIITHTSQQVMRCKMLAAGSAMVTLPRDVAIQVLLLPMVYSILAAKNVCNTWSRMTNHFEPALYCFNRTDAEKRTLLDDSFEANFALADMYEAWALYCFGQMVGKVLEPDLRKKIRLEVVKAFESLLLIDVSVFVLVCVVGAYYQIFITWCKWRFGLDLCEKIPAVCSIGPYLVGAKWCSSSIAIYNLFTVEHKFGLLSTMITFGPNLKFWSIKIMVLVAFWMALAMVIVRDACHLTSDQSQLLDASFRIYVMAFVAIINLKAWWPWSSWYENVDQEENFRFHAQLSFKEMTRPLTEVGVKHVPPGAISLVRQLLGVDEDSAQSWEHVETVIKGLDEASLDRALHHGSQIGWAVTELHGTGKARHRRAMMDMDFEERRDALMQHLQGFYPQV
mmetsp:Transcript_75/g.274  ORF Transcript_75/g.274 Transcript_75/m.274 type:complete len:654 (-) Transcript_75:45-2006(-)